MIKTTPLLGAGYLFNQVSYIVGLLSDYIEKNQVMRYYCLTTLEACMPR